MDALHSQRQKHSLGKRAKDPIDDHIRNLFGDGREDNRNKVNTWMETGWLTCKPYGINYEIDTKFFEIMNVNKLVREKPNPSTSTRLLGAR